MTFIQEALANAVGALIAAVILSWLQRASSWMQRAKKEKIHKDNVLTSTHDVEFETHAQATTHNITIILFPALFGLFASLIYLLYISRESGLNIFISSLIIALVFTAFFSLRRIFPLLLFPIAIYILIYLGSTSYTAQDFIQQPFVSIHMLSGDVWSIAVSDLLTFVSLAMLLIEMITAVGSGRELLYHGFSVLAFFVALILFITMRGFSTSVFFFITVMAGIGVVGGYTISIVAAEHDLGMGNTNTEIGMFRTFFPLLLISIVIYNLLAFGYGLTDNLVMHVFLKQSWAFHIFTGDTWNFNLGDLLILVSLGLLFLEIIKATRTTRRELFSHGLAAIVFVIALVEFITMKGFSTSVFFFITAMAAFDTVAEYMIGIVAAEHDLGMGRAGTD